MIIDVNTYIGHWPFRRLRYGTARGLIRLMDRAGIDVAVVSPLNSVFYVDPQEGNLELSEQLKSYGGRLVPLACVNPSNPSWEEDLEYCVEELGARGVRLHPNYHCYDLLEGCTLKLVRKAADMGLPIFISMRMEDERRSHWLVRVHPVPVRKVAELIRRFPEVSFVLTYIHYGEAEDLANLCPGMGNFFVDVSSHYLTSVYPDWLEKLAGMIGAGRILLGSQMPFQYPETALLKVRLSELEDQDKEKILGENAAKILQLY